MRILVCEDQKDLNKIITKHLTAEGYSADSCYDGQEALDFMDMADYDAVYARLQEKSKALTKAAGENERLLLELLERTKP